MFCERSRIGWPRFASAVAIAIAACGLTPTSAAADVQLVLPTTTLPGLRAAAAPLAAAQADLAAGLPGSLHSVAAGALNETAAARGAGFTLRSDAFVFGSPGGAARVLSAWRSARRARAAAFGYEARARRPVVVAWRDGDRIGVIALSASRRVSDPRAVAERYAVLANGWLRSPLPATAWGNVLAQIRPNGTVSKRTAEQAFVAVYGPLSGVAPPPGRRTVIPSGTLAAEWIMSYLKTLTRRQQRVVERMLGVRAPGRGAHAAILDDPDFHQDPVIQGIVDKWIGVESTMLGHPLGLKVIAGNTSTVVPGEYADTQRFNLDGSFGGPGAPQLCRIRVVPAGQKASSEFRSLFLAHEVFHCFQFDIMGSNGWTNLPAWIGEGTADWVALSVDPVPFNVGGVNLQTYIQTPLTPLFKRATDAVGFWGHADDVVPGLFKRLASIINAGSNEASFNLAVGSQDAFLSSWGSSPFRLNVTAPWEMHSPIDPPGFGTLPVGELIDPQILGGNGTVYAPPYTTMQYIVQTSPEEPVLHVVIKGHARLGTTDNYTDLENAWFCTAPGECFCPSGTTGPVPPTLPLAVSMGGRVALGISGDPDVPGTYGGLTSYPLSHFCRPNQPQPSPGSGGTGVDNGDPYISTFDGGGYGFQTAGEFTLVKSITDNLEIQSREVPYPKAFTEFRYRLAMNSAFAMRDGGAIVEVDTGAPQVLYIDHRRRFPADGQTIVLPGGGRVQYGAAQTIITWRDGTRARVFSIGNEGVNIAVTPSRRRAGLLRGLFGADDGHMSDDFISRNGHRYDAGAIQSVGLFVETKAQLHTLMTGFGRSWRITQRESLFVYPPGKNTRSYLVPGFPRLPVALHSFSRAVLAAAAAECRRAGVTNPTLLVGCEIDVAATGNHLLAATTGTLQHAAGIPAGPLTSPGVSPIPWTQLSAGTDSNSSFLLPAVALANPATGTVVAAFDRFAHGSIESDTFTAGSGGIGAVARQTPISGWTSTGDPVLFAAPGGGLQMIFSGLHSSDPSDPLTGTVIAPRLGDGSYGPPVLASSQIDADLGTVEGAVLASDGSTPLWATAQNQALAVYRGASNAVANDLAPEAPGRSYDPTLAYDRSGRLWIAWYMTPTGSSQTGLYMMQLDPATGAAAGPPLHVPSSDQINQLEEGRPAIACEQICRVVYVQMHGFNSNLLSWAPGDAAPVLVSRVPIAVLRPSRAAR